MPTLAHARILLTCQDSCSEFRWKSYFAWFLARFMKDLAKILFKIFARYFDRDNYQNTQEKFLSRSYQGYTHKICWTRIRIKSYSRFTKSYQIRKDQVSIWQDLVKILSKKNLNKNYFLGIPEESNGCNPAKNSWQDLVKILCKIFLLGSYILWLIHFLSHKNLNKLSIAIVLYHSCHFLNHTH